MPAFQERSLIYACLDGDDAEYGRILPWRKKSEMWIRICRSSSFRPKTMKEDIIKGYKLGADDYITKPFDSDVLLHKIKAMLKRNEELHKEQENKEYDLGKFHFNPRLRQLGIGKDVQTLSPKENELLKMLAEYKNDLLPREAALKKIWGSDTYFNGRSMDVYIAKLRKYLKSDANLEIVNIHGNGFQIGGNQAG